MTHEEYRQAANYWVEKDVNAVKMEQDELKKYVEAAILAHNTCALATGYGDFVRCTPIEYTYREGAFWLFSEGGTKFIPLEHNPNVCLAIYDPYGGFNGLFGLQVTGIAEMIEPFCEEYLAAAKAKNLSEAAMRKFSKPMNLIKITPSVIDCISSDFKKQGFSPRQRLIVSKKTFD